MLTHGGKLREASRRYRIPLENWLDLSTGVNPRCYPIPVIPDAVWNRLPEDDDGLIEAACSYYNTTSLLSVAGSQAAIQSLPAIRRQLFPESSTVAVPNVGYREHRYAWEKHGYKVLTYDNEPTNEQLHTADVVVVINPNNPTGYFTDKSSLLDQHAVLSNHNGWLVVDEAFIDCTPERSISANTPLQNLIVFRSIGKFFGLAGIRAGFVLAENHVLQAIQEHLGPWTVPAPSREVCKAALADTSWQVSNRALLKELSQQLQDSLTCHFETVHSTDLFSTVITEKAEKLHTYLCEKGILTRLLDEGNGVRFGLSGSEQELLILDRALTELAGD